MEKELDVIGSKELINFPKLGIFDVPAKVDTGADRSSVWASNIKEEKGLLSFALFDKGSKFYTGEKITTDEYTATEVRNSFGDKEIRYQVKLTVKIGGRKLIVNFNLANRSRNLFPVLIGKATLRGKFIVNVKEAFERTTHSRTPRILVLTPKAADKFSDFVNKLNLDFSDDFICDYASINDLLFELEPGKVSITVADSRKNIKDYDLVYFMKYINAEERASAAADYLTHHKVQFIDSEVAQFHSKTKLTQYAKLALNDLPVPHSLFMSHRYLKKSYDLLTEKLNLPFILKDIASERGENNHLIKNQAEFNDLLEQSPESLEFIAQAFVPNNGDIRLLVFDKNIYTAIGRSGVLGSHLSNTSKGGSAQILDHLSLESEARTIAIKAAIIMSREVAGVDLIQDKNTNEWFLLEVNNAPQIATGSFTEEKRREFGNFLRKYLKKSIIR